MSEPEKPKDSDQVSRAEADTQPPIPPIVHGGPNAPPPQAVSSGSATVASPAKQPEPIEANVPTPTSTPNQPFVSTSYFDLLKAVVVDPSLNGEQKEAMLGLLKKMGPTSDRLTYRLAISFIGIIAIVTVIVIWGLLSSGTPPTSVPDGLIAIASGAVGGLAGLLSPSRNNDSNG